jgi:hypothetical protein
VRISAHDDSYFTTGPESQDQVWEHVRHGAEEPVVLAHAGYLLAIDVDSPPNERTNAEPSLGSAITALPLTRGSDGASEPR